MPWHGQYYRERGAGTLEAERIHSVYRYKQSIACNLFAAAVSVWLFGCAASGFDIVRIGSPVYQPSDAVELIKLEPKRPYDIVGRFSGSEMALCRPGEPYCTLRDQARSLGANAIWIQQTRTAVRPEQWVNIRGAMTRVPPENYETIEGVLIRYRD
jgi:hypothetical protein